MRYHSGYGMHRPMMSVPQESMYDQHRAHWYAPTPYWDSHSAPFMVKDPRYTQPHPIEQYPMMYPQYYPHSPHYVPMQH